MTVSITDLERRLAIAEHALKSYLGIDLGHVEDSLLATERGATEPAPGEHVAGSIPDPPPAQPAEETPVTVETAEATSEGTGTTEPPAEGTTEPPTPEEPPAGTGTGDGTQGGNPPEPPPAGDGTEPPAS